MIVEYPPLFRGRRAEVAHDGDLIPVLVGSSGKSASFKGSRILSMKGAVEVGGDGLRVNIGLVWKGSHRWQIQ